MAGKLNVMNTQCFAILPVIKMKVQSTGMMNLKTKKWVGGRDKTAKTENIRNYESFTP